MNVNKILPFLLLLPFLASCTSKYKIEGTSSVNSLDGKMLYLKSLRDGEWVKLDSAEVVHGLFSMKGKIDSVQMVTLYMDEARRPGRRRRRGSGRRIWRSKIGSLTVI